jgi:LmbE family N-acetylglucosaminyl deacetylase
MIVWKRIMVLSPHTDDGELAAGGTIAKLADAGCDIQYLCFSSAETSLPKGLSKDTLRRECRKATEILGIPQKNVIILKYRVREFHHSRQKILDDILEYGKKYEPELVLIPSSNDLHQDHHTVHQEAVRAFKKNSSIWGYEHPWNNMSFTTDIFVDLEEKYIKKKIAALKRYASQEYRTYLDEKYILAWAYMRGTQIDVPYAETFEMIRMLVK